MAQLKETTHKRPADDPLLRRMLATHIHCGEPMQLVTDTTTAMGPQESHNGGVLLAYRCACGFTFDKR